MVEMMKAPEFANVSSVLCFTFRFVAFSLACLIVALAMLGFFFTSSILCLLLLLLLLRLSLHVCLYHGASQVVSVFPPVVPANLSTPKSLHSNCLYSIQYAPSSFWCDLYNIFLRSRSLTSFDDVDYHSNRCISIPMKRVFVALIVQ